MTWKRRISAGAMLALAASAAGASAQRGGPRLDGPPFDGPRLDGFVWPDRAGVAGAVRRMPPSFGAAVAVEGRVALIGAPSAVRGGRRSGAVHVAVRTARGGDWLAPPGSDLDPGPVGAGARFGAALDLEAPPSAGEGIAAAGAPSAHGPGGALSGLVRVFAVDVRTGRSRWLTDLAPPRGSEGAAFGSSVAVGTAPGGATRIAVGAPRARAHAGGMRSGAVLVFERSAGAPPAAWCHVHTLAPPSGGIADDFGASVCFAGPGVVVGAPGTGGHAPGAGTAYVFDRRGRLRWRLAAPASDPNRSAGARYGTRVCALGPSRIAVAAFGRAAVEVVDLRPGGPSHRALLRGDPIGGFGLALAGDADEVWVGAPFAGPDGAGAVHRFVRVGTGYSDVGALRPEPPTADGEFGLALDLVRRPDGSVAALVGEPRSDQPCPVEAPRCASGRVVVYGTDAP
ncbi:MAG: hypothetical protein AAGB93_20440 [Planctomycetota bacterium]